MLFDTMKNFCKRIYLFLLVTTACSPGRNLVYFDDLATSKEFRTPINNQSNIRIQPGDLLDISISSLSPESNLLFNSGIIVPPGTPITAPRLNEGYLVNNDGYINFPVLGRVSLAGLTREQATEKLTVEISKLAKTTIVNLRILNFQVTVIGEVNNPSLFMVPSGKLNVLEALGLAGDLTEFARRDNILIIRENNGERVAMRLNLNSREILNSPFYYLQQNDVVYVEPYNKVKIAQTEPENRYIPIWAAAISTLAFSILTFFR